MSVSLEIASGMCSTQTWFTCGESRRPGRNLIVVRTVHTHELAVDRLGNVYGEDNRDLGSGEGDDRSAPDLASQSERADYTHRPVAHRFLA
ncbi:MAG: hypothetical protein H7Z74_02590 [Anaerolineae bacterium]|nr:hypothetical protein [Gemmatimonadaceae bacterium]